MFEDLDSKLDVVVGLGARNINMTVDTRKQSEQRFKNRFGNIDEFKKKVLAEHVEQCDHSDHCLECMSAGIKQRSIKDEDLKI